MPLKSRRQFPPYGWIFYEPKTGWNAPDGLTFEECVNAIITHRLANPRFASQWMTDVAGVSAELDHYTCLRLNNDPNYCDSGDPPNFNPASFSHAQRTGQSPRRVASVGSVGNHAGKTVAGIGILIDWFGSGLQPVSKELAEKRAAVCVECPLNQEGNFFQRIEASIAKKIKTAIAIKNDMNLSTSFDERLHSCLACDCSNKLKPWVSIEHIKEHTSETVKAEFLKGKNCWILKEMQ